MNFSELTKSKTFWTGITAVLAAAGGFFTGEFTAPVAIQLAITGLIGIFLRQGVGTGEK